MKIFDKNRFSIKPDAVLFDTDNTLYAYPPAHNAGMEAVRKKAFELFSVNPSEFNAAFASARTEIKKQLQKTASSHSRLLYFQRVLELMGLGSQVLRALDLEQTYWRTFLTNAPLFQGVTDFLDDLRIEGIPIAIVTDLTAQIQFRKIVYFGLDHYFDYIVTSEESGADKPNPASFEMAINKIQPKGQTYWMIGDDACNDIYGARSSIGAICIQKVHSGVEVGKNDQKPDAIIEHFSEARKLLKLYSQKTSENSQIKAQSKKLAESTA